MELDLLFVQPIPDWREEAIRQLEPDIKLYAYRFHIKGMEPDDVAQEMRLQLWRKLEKYDPMKSGLRTWAQRVMRNRCTDLHRRANDMLDHEKRVFPETFDF